MRVLGLILLALGVLGLGWHGFADELGTVIREHQQTVRVPPVVSGIAVVSGLILLASTDRREEF